MKMNKILSIIAIVAMIGFIFTACEEDSGPKGSYKTTTSPNAAILDFGEGYTAMTASEAQAFLDEILEMLDFEDLLSGEGGNGYLNQVIVPVNAVPAARATESEREDFEADELGPNTELLGFAEYSFTETETKMSGNGKIDAKLTMSKGNELLEEMGAEIIGEVTAFASVKFSASINESSMSMSANGSASGNTRFAVNIANDEKKYVKLLGSVELSSSAKASMNENSESYSGSGKIKITITAYGEEELIKISDTINIKVVDNETITIKSSGFFEIDEEIPLGDLMGEDW